MVLLEMTTYVTLLVLTCFRFLLDGGYQLLIRDLSFIIVNLLAWFPNMAAGMLIRYYVIPVFSWLGFGPRGSIVGRIGPETRARYGEFVEVPELLAYMQSLALSWHFEEDGVPA
ncbi:hypothetical protein CSHISOI_11092 [Colletotrichum shisoi]|uniref:Uncharacterized protein n=1 Tax=Colletotrichum shisoi TaxID=2078593 RepID=A0A5Q4BCH8_9PEZI|nr:hypothetical protein CSHISOI_11092 [Colletotrichum shisoi]